MGSQSLLIQCSEILLGGGHQILAVVSDNPSIVRWTLDHGIRHLTYKAELEQELAGEPFDYLFSITNLSIIPEAVLAMPRRQAINFHDGPLPRYAGLVAPAWALMNRETEYGITYHEMTSAVDEGLVLKQRLFEISPEETSLTINTKCFEAGIEAFEELVPELASGTNSPQAQDLTQKSYCGKFDRPAAAGIIDWSKPADQCEALIRALYFGDYENPLAAAKLTHAGKTVVVTTAAAIEHEGVEPAGTVLEATDREIVVAAGSDDGQGALRLSGFTTVHGADLTVRQAATELGITAGSLLDAIASFDAPRLEELNNTLARHEAFWVRRLATLEPVDIPYLNAERRNLESVRFEVREVPVPASFTTDFCDGNEHPADAVVAAIGAYLARVSGQDFISIAFADPELATAIEGAEAWVSNRIPLSIKYGSELLIGELFEQSAAELARVRKRCSWLHDAIARHPALGANPMLRGGGLLTVGIEISDRAVVPAPETELLIRVSEDGRKVELHHDTQVVDDIAALESQIALFLSGLVAAGPGQRVAEVSLLSLEDRERVLCGFNDTAVDYPRDSCTHELIAQQTERTPDATALVFENQSCSYSELNTRANQLAQHLRAKGVGPDSLVGVHVDRGIDMMVSILGVQKAGGAYVPLDPAYPASRIALMIEDSGAEVIVTQTNRVAELSQHDTALVCVDGDWTEISGRPDTCPDSGVGPSNLAYVIYTSGSTGRPKGVMVEHRNVVNFFAGMDERVAHDPSGVWLAVTSLSFDISVLELLFSLSRGFKVVIYADSTKTAATSPIADQPMDFGLFMWGADDSTGRNKYELMLESAKFGDRNGFSSFWTPERHFHNFGGPYPNPAVTGAAVAAVTERIGIRAGSCVLPLHMPIRVAEEWAAVDNLSGGRVGLGLAAGWQPNDFVINPEGYKEAKVNLFRDLETVKALWRGDSVDFVNPLDKQIAVTTQPRPLQKELPVWITTAGNVETYRMAGEVGSNLLTHLLGQSLEEVAEKIQVYREALAAAGHDPASGIVTLMLHTLVGEDDEAVREMAREPMKNYLGSSVSLVKDFAWAFPAFRRPGGAEAAPTDIDIDSLTGEEVDAILEFAFERYYEHSGLFGSVETCLATVERVKAIGVDEIGCLIDYGVSTEDMLKSLHFLNQVRERSNVAAASAENDPQDEFDVSLPAQVARHEVSHLQCTPSMARMLVIDQDAHPVLRQIDHLMIGGEAFPVALAHDLDGLADCTVTNMYGPTETTIWSSTVPVSGRPDKLTIGKPIANTRFYVVDPNLQPVPIGVVGELMIGGDGVVRGYHERPDLTAERFIPDPFSEDPEARLYRTGDHARFDQDGNVEFLGRMDHQVKIRGYRVELGEIETRLTQHESIQECVAIVREDTPDDQRLIAYAVAQGAPADPDELAAHLGETLPEFMIPSAFYYLDQLPLTPNAKIDRKALPAPDTLLSYAKAEYVEPGSDLERTIVTVWKDVLKLDQVGSRDNFFDLGGHSLLVVQAHRALREKIEQPISLTDLYRFPTVEALAAHLQSDGEGDSAADAGLDRAEKRKAARSRRRRQGRHK
ncbi:MAG: LLM class flavin-dependent oxidoreductase [bacterium]|nr:LLM class flavin-dependent oxidoreductase [bacterium]MCP5067769.1 LLM class flavin-dependent oxidoreductase [bacterium]